ncbi:hypothetical protein B296_00017271 [Ensete ventricosum]|uniref:Protein kinase domain-containing protein n=1 Tax=Ensete ventricosum TaxID=4639 RepID=A0A426ZRA6_ENSVE|nr:hypothetical protein B296_00017271 [Ensete ventricosum]
MQITTMDFTSSERLHIKDNGPLQTEVPTSAYKTHSYLEVKIGYKANQTRTAKLTANPLLAVQGMYTNRRTDKHEHFIEHLVYIFVRDSTLPCSSGEGQTSDLFVDADWCAPCLTLLIERRAGTMSLPETNVRAESDMSIWPCEGHMTVFVELAKICPIRSVKTFSLAEMEKATNRFDDLKIIGEGGFGRVYEGTLEDGTRVAIKVLKRDDQEGADKETAVLNWNTRLKVALGAARGLAYLHEDSSPRVIHRDFKSSNILLEDDFTPKVSDFGLARTAMGEGNEYISTRVMGTFGYVAPEYAMTGHLLVKSDVYSYGVVLLELLTGRKPVDMLRPPGQENLVTWARPLLTSRDGLESIIDPSLGNDIPFDSLAKVAAIASMCVQPEVDQRPFMGEVVQALKLVYNEGDDCRVSENFSPEETSTLDKEPRISGGWDMGSDTVLSESEILNVSARFTRDASSSFHRYSSSGPLRPGRSQQFWHRVRGLTSGSASEHGTFDKGLEAGDQWV